jgi:hypothetical protein
MTPDTRFGISFWIAVFVLAAASVGCFGYAEMQLRPVKLRSPISFTRTT